MCYCPFAELFKMYVSFLFFCSTIYLNPSSDSVSPVSNGQRNEPSNEGIYNISPNLLFSAEQPSGTSNPTDKAVKQDEPSDFQRYIYVQYREK